MGDSNNKLPFGIIDTIINKISDFTKELEILRGQLPNRDMLDECTSKIIKAVEDLDVLIKELKDSLARLVLVIKLVLGGVVIVVGLSIFGVKLLDYMEIKQAAKIISSEESEKLKDILKRELREELLEDLTNGFDSLD